MTKSGLYAKLINTVSQENPNSIQPIRPEDIVDNKIELFPDAIFATFNTLITQKFSAGVSTVMQDDVVSMLKEVGLDIDEVYKKGWLNVEEVYRASGWEVNYVRPGYNETGKSYFVFKSPKAKS